MTTTQFCPGRISRLLALASLILIVTVSGFLAGCNHKKDNPEPPLGATDSLRFVFLADSRGDTMPFPVDTTALNPIIRQIAKLSPLPQFVIFGGDMAYRGYMNDSYQFDYFKSLFKPITDQGITLYTALGNHELYHHHSSYGMLKVNQEHYQSAFTDNPSNGPTGYNRLAYTLTHSGTSSFFAILDPYYVNQDTIHTGLGGHIDTVQMNWLKKQVAASGALHKFLVIHTPYYYVNEDSTEPSSADTTMTRLWSFIDVNRFDMYLCGHSHLYSRKTIDDTIAANPKTTPPTPPWQNKVVQLLNGTCGAGPSTEVVKPSFRTDWHVFNDDTTYYFSVIDVKGNTVKVNSYKGFTGAFTVMDSFEITK